MQVRYALAYPIVDRDESSFGFERRLDRQLQFLSGFKKRPNLRSRQISQCDDVLRGNQQDMPRKQRRWSRKAIASSPRHTIRAGIFPETISQKMQLMM